MVHALYFMISLFFLKKKKTHYILVSESGNGSFFFNYLGSIKEFCVWPNNTKLNRKVKVLKDVVAKSKKFEFVIYDFYWSAL